MDKPSFVSNNGSIETPLEPTRSVQLNLKNKIEKIAGTGSFQWDLTKDYFYCTDNFLVITEIGGKHGQLSSQAFFSIIELEKRNYVLEVMHECITLNQEFEVTFRITSSESKVIRLHGFPEGDVTHKLLIGFIVDISNEIHLDHQILKGQDMERKRISMELHDSVGQKCIALKYMLTLRQMKNDFSDLEGVNESIDEIINEIRSITHNLSSEIVPEIGFENAIRQILEESAEAINAESKLSFKLSDELNLSLDISKMLYRIVQEALSNIMKYSQATNVSVSLKNQNRQLILKISDNGIGFDTSTYSNGIGMQNIKKRVSYLNGFVNIKSNLGFGTVITIKIPT